MPFLRYFMGFICCLAINMPLSLGQIQSDLQEAMLRNSRWEFTYSSHLQSDDVIFRAEDGYDHFIWFKYNDTAYTFFNGEMSAAAWSLKKGELEYHFSKRSKWRLAELNSNAMQLEFLMGDSVAYRYHFVRVDEEATPFFKYGAGELREAKVRRRIMGEDPHPYRFLKDEKGKRFRKGAKKKKQGIILPEEAEEEFLQVEMGGGGFFGKPDFVYRNHVVIKTNGRVIRELQNEAQGLRVWKSNISRAHLEELVAFVEKRGFFEMEQVYTCETNDCMTRMREKPRPIALRIAITKGGKRKVVTISVFEGVGAARHLVSYPPEIDAIYKAIDDVSMMAVSQ
jgi:hypothetical protein